VRELHVYGNLQSKNTEHHGQHLGIGKFLIRIAETIGKILKMEQVVIISGVGVQKYYENQGYHLSKEDEYEIKNIIHQKIPNHICLNNQLCIHSKFLRSFLNCSLSKQIVSFQTKPNNLIYYIIISLLVIIIYTYFLN
jgi:hypothetical protein